MNSMPHFLKRATAVSEEDHCLAPHPGSRHKVENDKWFVGHAEALGPLALPSGTHGYTYNHKPRKKYMKQYRSHTDLSDMLWDTWCMTQLWCTGTRRWLSAVERKEGKMTVDYLASESTTSTPKCKGHTHIQVSAWETLDSWHEHMDNVDDKVFGGKKQTDPLTNNCEQDMYRVGHFRVNK